MAAKFIPRQSFPYYGSIQRSYYLGHHRAGLNKMKNMLSSIDYVVECRDYRVPITSINPVFEEALGSTRRLIVYTKRDLGADARSFARQQVSSRNAIVLRYVVFGRYSPCMVFIAFFFRRSKRRYKASIARVPSSSLAHPRART